MLYECRHTIPPEETCRLLWFHNSFFDLDIWVRPDGGVDRFLLCYDKPLDQRAIAWRSGDRYEHFRVDDGEDLPGRTKASPVLVPDGMVDVVPLAARFYLESRDMDSDLSRFVYRKILAFPSRRSC